MPMLAATIHPPAPSPQTKPRVLIADDSRVVRLAIKKILGTKYDLVEVGDGASAWERLGADAEIQALVTDIEMPNVDGYELICRIRGAEETRLRDLPVIAITGADDEETKQRAFACGATDFIIKPIDAIQLQARVQAYVRYDRNARELTEKSALLEDQAIVDLMTGLSSRRYLIQRGEQDLAHAVRRNSDLSLIRVDIDQFKKLYKTHGDDTSEALLTWFAKVFLDNARTEDTVARVGGAQFAVLAGATGIEAATTLCQRLQEGVASRPYRHGNITIPITLSIGMASLLQDRRSNIEDMLTLAHQRLCHAQSEGGNRVCSSILDLQAIEEVVAPFVEAPDDILLSLPETTEAPVYADTLTIAEPDETGNVVAPPVETATDTLPSLLDPFAGPVHTDALTIPELEAIVNPEDLLSIDKALHLLALGQIDVLAPCLDALLGKVQPLLDYAAQVRIHNTGLPGGEKSR